MTGPSGQDRARVLGPLAHVALARDRRLEAQVYLVKRSSWQAARARASLAEVARVTQALHRGVKWPRRGEPAPGHARRTRGATLAWLVGLVIVVACHEPAAPRAAAPSAAHRERLRPRRQLLARTRPAPPPGPLGVRRLVGLAWLRPRGRRRLPHGGHRCAGVERCLHGAGRRARHGLLRGPSRRPDRVRRKRRIACGDDDVDESTRTDCAALGATCARGERGRWARQLRLRQPEALPARGDARALRRARRRAELPRRSRRAGPLHRRDALPRARPRGRRRVRDVRGRRPRRMRRRRHALPWRPARRLRGPRPLQPRPGDRLRRPRSHLLAARRRRPGRSLRRAARTVRAARGPVRRRLPGLLRGRPTGQGLVRPPGARVLRSGRAWPRSRMRGRQGARPAGKTAARESRRLLRHIARWDLDKTYLRTEFDTLRDLVRTALERPDEKRTNPGAVDAPARDGARRRLASTSSPARPSRCAAASRTSSASTASRGTASRSSPTCRTSSASASARVKDQLGYKLPALLQARADARRAATRVARRRRPAPKETLFGDDAEADAFVYSLYADVVAGRVSEETPLRGVRARPRLPRRPRDDAPSTRA